MTREEFESFLLAVTFFALLMALISALRFRSKGISALLQCAAFGLFALGAWFVRGNMSAALQYFAFGGVAACLAADALVRSAKSGGSTPSSTGSRNEGVLVDGDVDPPGEGK